RQKANEKQEQRRENPEGADECPDVDPGRNKQAPRGRNEITMQSADDDDEPLEPHAGVPEHQDEIKNEDVAAAPVEPKQLRRKHIAKQHPDPPVPPVGTKDAVPKREL